MLQNLASQWHSSHSTLLLSSLIASRTSLICKHPLFLSTIPFLISLSQLSTSYNFRLYSSLIGARIHGSICADNEPTCSPNERLLNPDSSSSLHFTCNPQNVLHYTKILGASPWYYWWASIQRLRFLLRAFPRTSMISADAVVKLCSNFLVDQFQNLIPLLLLQSTGSSVSRPVFGAYLTILVPDIDFKQIKLCTETACVFRLI